MKRKIIIITVIILIIIGIILLFIKNKMEDQPIEVTNNTEVIEQKEENITEEINETTESNETNTTEEIKNETTPVETPKKEETPVKKTSNSNKKPTSQNNNTPTTQEPTPTPEPTITYYCPDGYTLSGNKCTHTVAANKGCPQNTHDYSNDGIPRDTYCVNLSDGYETEDNSCPSGYGIISVIGFGTPTTYKCLKLYKKVYTCENDYILNGTNCTKTIDAQTK